MGIGRSYVRKAPVPAAKRRRVLIAAWDLSEQDAQTVAHEKALDALAMLVTASGLIPLLPAVGDPLFDLAYERGKALFVVEVKSIPQDLAGQRQQIRLGLGQLLEYACVLSKRHTDVRSVLLLASEPSDAVGRLAHETCRRQHVSFRFAPLPFLPHVVPSLTA